MCLNKKGSEKYFLKERSTISKLPTIICKVFILKLSSPEDVNRTWSDNNLILLFQVLLSPLNVKKLWLPSHATGNSNHVHTCKE